MKVNKKYMKIIVIVILVISVIGPKRILALIAPNAMANILFGNDYCKQSLYYFDNPVKGEKVIEREYYDEEHSGLSGTADIVRKKCKLCGRTEISSSSRKVTLCSECAKKTNRCRECGKRLIEN